MDVFQFRDQIISDYGTFTRSFTTIRADDIKGVVDEEYARGRFWPAPLIQLNPNFVSGGTVDDLVQEGVLHPECSRIFRVKPIPDSMGEQITLHKHQVDAIRISKQKQSYVLTTGTGSGKSLAYFIPIVDDVLRQKQDGTHTPKISAIIVYPMNALCNSQYEALHSFLVHGYGLGNEPVTFARYTGQEDAAERERIAKDPPDILLTNYVMLELMMTRFTDVDKALRRHAEGLRYLVLDELHTYRGRQGADVAMLVRRVRERFNPELQCIGTSATMASEGDDAERNEAVARVARLLFGTPVKADHIISETLEPVVDPETPLDGGSLRNAIIAGVPSGITFDQLRRHPVAAWVERNLGLEERENRLVRVSQPRSVDEAASSLSEACGLPVETCKAYLADFLLRAYHVKGPRGQSFFAFRLHQFVSGAGNAYATLESPGQRHVTLDGQRFVPGDRTRRLYNLAFCRHCGQEYFPVSIRTAGGQVVDVTSRELNEVSEKDDEQVRDGYLVPDTPGFFDASNMDEYPENWREVHRGVERLRYNYRKYVPERFEILPEGKEAPGGQPMWFVPGRLQFCLHCKAYEGGGRRSEISKLSTLGGEGEGRSSATTVLTLSALRHMMATELDDEAKKLLGFTDNRQDASLQAGHFNDFIQILLLRGALLAAIRSEPDRVLRDEVLTHRVLERLQLEPADYAASPEAKGGAAENARRALRDVLGYRLYFDLRRGWRFASPNLEQLRLLETRYSGLEDCCNDEEEWSKVDPLLASLHPSRRYELALELLESMRRSLCIKTIYLDEYFQESLRNRSYNLLTEPWGLTEEERLTSGSFMVPRPRDRTRREYNIVYMSHRSRFGRRVSARSRWVYDNPHLEKNLDEDRYNAIIDDMLQVLTTYGLVESSVLPNGHTGYRLDASLLEWTVPGDGQSETAEDEASTNVFFRQLYENVARMLAVSDRFLHQLEGREHTAQVDAATREDREERFRRGMAPEEVEGGNPRPRGLPVMFCSPTMELGVDISTLNTVYMRNVPPTPANYAQRSGRAGRSGQPALVLTYCAARSPHDQHFFADPPKMVAGVVSPPSIDLANRDLVETHLHAVWLAETGAELPSGVKDMLDLGDTEQYPLDRFYVDQMGRAQVRASALKRARRIVDMLRSDIDPITAPWMTDSWLEGVISGSMLRFDRAFDRWRSHFKATTLQMELAHGILHNAAATESERRDAHRRYTEAHHQRAVLLSEDASRDEDFGTYRYLASEGFLPGYNFPRLPLRAFIPARRQGVGRNSFLSRPRFIGLSEFGPQSFIYHEGSRYRVRRVIMGVRTEQAVSVDGNIPLETARICAACGYGHFRDESDFELCVNCSERLEHGLYVNNLYGIEQVSTVRADRITSDEEERQRRGYETITTLRYAQDNGRIRADTIAVSLGDEPLLTLRYGPAATIWRINLGWRQRVEKSIHGFALDVTTGEWTRDSQAPTDTEDDDMTEGKTVRRVTPYVLDTKNALILQPQQPLSETAMATVQYAIKRAIEMEFQLEAAELAAEPLPNRSERRAVLFYEAAEGGAGVLSRFVTDVHEVMPRIARRALTICHFGSASGRWSNYEDLVNEEPKTCEAGCYRCLLSYYNQMDHDLVDRRDRQALEFLLKLVHSTASIVPQTSEQRDSIDQLKAISTSSLERKWLDVVEQRGYRLPDKAQPLLNRYNTRPDFAYSDAQVLVYIDGPHHETERQRRLDEQITRNLEDAGFTVIRFGTDELTWQRVFEEFAWVFGTGGQAEDGKLSI